MLGVVLCGGQSTRMGSDKGLLKYRSKTWAQITVDKIDELGIPIVISINKDQLKDYSAIFSSQSLIVDDDSLQIKGPLAGLLSIHIRYPKDDLLILACDMLQMESGLLKELLIEYDQQTNHDAFVYTNDKEIEPLCGIYKAKGLSNILGFYKAGQLVKHSIKYALSQINTYTIPISDNKKNCFRNFNTPEELNRL